MASTFAPAADKADAAVGLRPPITRDDPSGFSIR